LRGEPQTVVGATSELAGQFVLDLEDLTQTQFSDFVVNARTFVTGSSNRDRAIRGPIILNSATDEFEFITFSVKEALGLDGSAGLGDTLTFTLVGDLTIRDQTNEVEFEVTATLVDASTVDGTATADVLRSDFGIGIPNVPSVADVTDEVTLQLEFVATSS
jgi:polyisoprenoid-binding protein YceI